MSSIYQDKSPQELLPKLETYITNYPEKIGEPFSVTDLVTRLNKRIEDEKQKMFLSVYGTCSVREMRDLIKLAAEISKSSLEKPMAMIEEERIEPKEFRSELLGEMPKDEPTSTAKSKKPRK